MAVLDLYELLKRLRYELVRPEAISIGEPFLEDTYCLERKHGEWRVFYFEHGERVALAVFEDEAAACSKFLSVVLGDATTRSR